MRYYMLHFSGEVFKFCRDQKKLVEIVESYQDIDRCIQDDGDDKCCNFYVGSKSLSRLEEIMDEVIKKDGFRRFQIEVYRSKKQALESYRYKKFY